MKSTLQDRSISGWSWFVTGGIVRTGLLGHCGRFAASSQKRERTQKQHHRESSPATTMAAPIAGLSMPSSIPIPVAATMKGSEVACKGGCQGTPLPYHRPVQGGRQPAGEQQGKENTGTSASAAPPERSAPTSSCIPLVMKKNGMKTPKADGLELRMEARVRHHLVAIQQPEYSTGEERA